MLIRFFVDGIAQTAGSKRATRRSRTGCIDDNKLTYRWQRHVAMIARMHWRREPLRVPIRVHFRFVRPRPQSHFKANGELKPNAPEHCAKRPDALKLARAVEDALTDVVYDDDALIVGELIEKAFGERIGVEIGISDAIPGPHALLDEPKLASWHPEADDQIRRGLSHVRS